MENTKSKAKQGKKKSKKGEDSEDRREGRNSRRDRSQGRRRPRSLSRENTEVQQSSELKGSKKAKPSFASFSLHGHLLCDEPEVSETLEVQLLDMEEAELKACTKSEKFEADLVFERAQVQKLQEKLTKKEKEAKKTLESTHTSHRLKTEKQTEEIKTPSSLKKAEDMLEIERLCWQKTKKSRALFEDQPHKQKHENKTLVAALRNVEQKFESHQVEWQEEKTSFIQATEGFKKTLQDMQQEEKEAVKRSQASHQAQLEEHREETRKIASALKKAEDLLETECLCWQQEKSSLLEEMEKSRALYEAQLDEEKHKNDNLVAALRNVEQKLESHQVEWQEEKTSFIQATEGFKKTLQDMQQEAKEAVERSQASHQAQLEEHREETRKFASALKKAEDLLETQCLCWQQEKTSLLEETEQSRALFEAQLDEQTCENKTLAAALRNVEQKLESHQVEWQEEKTSLIQATDSIEKMLQQKEREWEEKESSLKTEKQTEEIKTPSSLKKAEDMLEIERLCWQKTKKSRALFEDQPHKQKHENKTLVAALRNVEQKFESHQVEWQEEKTSFIQATEGFKKTLQDMQQEEKEAVKRSQASHQDQLEEHREETRKIASALKKAEDLVETQCLCWQQEKTSLLEETEKSRALLEAQLDEQTCENKTLAAALRNVEQKLESHQVEWQEEKTSLIQATDSIEKMLQQKEQEWEEKESSMKSQLEELTSKKKKKKKWYRRFFQFICPCLVTENDD